MPLFDLHSHFSFKPANSHALGDGAIPDTDHWRERFTPKKDFSKKIMALEKTVVKSSQLDGNAAMDGGFRIVCNALYPLEQRFTSKLLLKDIGMLTGHAPEVIWDIFNWKYSNFQRLEREYTNLLAGQRNGRNAEGDYSYRVVDSYAEIERTLNGAPDTLCIVNSVEGAHAFADNLVDRLGHPLDIYAEERRFMRSVRPRGGDSWFELYVAAMVNNIDKVTSNWAHTPFFVNLAHHYYNHLCGHSPSLTGMVDFLLPQEGGAPNGAGPDTNYYHLGIRPWGLKVVAQLLKRRTQLGQPVRRVLIDTKHMSPQARLDYYTTVVDPRREQFQDPIPIIASHTAVSGRKEMARSIANDYDLLPDEREPSRYFYDGIINLFDDEIRRIVASDGIMGLMIDERRIMGNDVTPESGLTNKSYKQASDANKQLMKDWTMVGHRHAWGELSDVEYAQERKRVEDSMAPLLDRLRPAYLSVVLRQVFHILDLVGQDGWGHIAIGTDYDGVINPIDVYKRSSDMRTLPKDLESFWTAMTQHPDAGIRELYGRHLYGKSIRYWVNKLLWQNGNDFLKAYFTDDYLLKGRPV